MPAGHFGSTTGVFSGGGGAGEAAIVSAGLAVVVVTVPDAGTPLLRLAPDAVAVERDAGGPAFSVDVERLMIAADWGGGTGATTGPGTGTGTGGSAPAVGTLSPTAAAVAALPAVVGVVAAAFALAPLSLVVADAFREFVVFEVDVRSAVVPIVCTIRASIVE
jgi:hypothetical protein